MGRNNTPILTDSEKQELEQGYKYGDRHCFRVHCHLILLKAEGRTSAEVGAIVGMTGISVNHWVLRYKNEGINGLKIKQGRGRKPKLSLNNEQHTKVVDQAVLDNSYDIGRIQIAIQDALTIELSRDTIKRFLKKVTTHGNVSE